MPSILARLERLNRDIVLTGCCCLLIVGEPEFSHLERQRILELIFALGRLSVACHNLEVSVRDALVLDWIFG